MALFYEPHEFYELALVQERRTRQELARLREITMPLTAAVTTARTADMYPGLSNGLYEAVGLLGANPLSPGVAGIAIADVVQQAYEMEGMADEATAQAIAEERTRNVQAIEQGDLPIVDTGSWLGNAKQRGAWWAKPVDGLQNIVQSFFLATDLFPQATIETMAFKHGLEREWDRQGVPQSERPRINTMWDQFFASMAGVDINQGGAIQAPRPVAVRAFQEAIEGEPVNLGDTWFNAGGVLAPETERRLAAGFDFDAAVDNSEQAQLGVPLGYEWNERMSQAPLRFASGEVVPASFGNLVATEMFDANTWGAKAAAGVATMIGYSLTDPIGAAIGAGYAGASKAVKVVKAPGTRGMGFTVDEILKLPTGSKLRQQILNVADNPVALNRAVSRATRVSDPSVGHMLAVAARAGDDAFRDALETLVSKGAIANTFEPVSVTGYLARRQFLRSLDADGVPTAAGRMAGRYIDMMSQKRKLMPTAGAALFGLSPFARKVGPSATMRNISMLAGSTVGVRHAVDYRPGVARLVGNVARILPVNNGPAFVNALDDFNRSMGLTLDQRNEILSRAVLQPEIRATMPMRNTVDNWAMKRIEQGDAAIAAEFRNVVLDQLGAEPPLNVVRDSYLYFADNIADATGMDIEGRGRLRNLLGRIFDTSEEMRRYAMELSGEAMWQPNSRFLITDSTGKRKVSASAQDITEALSMNIPLMEPRQVRMLMRRAGMLGLFPRLGKRLGGLDVLTAEGVRGGRALRYAEFLKRNVEDITEPLRNVVKQGRNRRAILKADRWTDMPAGVVAELEKAGLRVEQWDEIKETARLVDEAFETMKAEDFDGGFIEAVIEEGGEAIILNDEGMSILDVLSSRQVATTPTGRAYQKIAGTPGSAAEALVEVLTRTQSNLWKPFVMLRPAYIFRVLGEEQVRMWFNGYRSAITHPLSFVALAMASRARNPERFDNFMRIFGKGKADTRAEWLRNGFDEATARLAGTFGVTIKDVDGVLTQSLDNFNDAMYKGRHNALIRGEPEQYIGEFKSVPFEREIGTGRVKDDVYVALAYDVIEMADRPMARLAAQALFLDNHPEGPEAALAILQGDDSYQLLRKVWDHMGRPTPAPTNNYTFGGQGLSEAVIGAFSGGADSPLWQWRSVIARTNDQMGKALRNDSVARSQAESYFARVFNTIGARYARRGYDGEGLVLNNSNQLASELLDPETLNLLSRRASMYPHEDWWMDEVLKADGPVRVLPTGTRAGEWGPDEVFADVTPAGQVQPPAQRMVVLAPQVTPDGRSSVKVVKSTTNGELLMQANVEVAMEGDRILRVTGVSDIAATLYDDMAVGTALREAIQAVDPRFFERTEVADVLTMQVNGKPLHRWFDEMNVQTSTVGVQSFTGNPRWGKSSVDEILKRKIEGSDVRFIDHLLDPERIALLPDDLRLKLQARQPARFVDEGDVVRTANGDYGILQVGEGRVLTMEDGSLQIRNLDEVQPPEIPDEAIQIELRVDTEGPVELATDAPPPRRVSKAVEPDDPDPILSPPNDPFDLSDYTDAQIRSIFPEGTLGEGDVPSMRRALQNMLRKEDPTEAEAQIRDAVMSRLRNADEAPPAQQAWVDGDYLDADEYPLVTLDMVQNRSAVPEVSGQHIPIARVGSARFPLLERLRADSMDPRFVHGLRVTGPQSMSVFDKDGVVNYLQRIMPELSESERRTIKSFINRIENEAKGRNPTVRFRRVTEADRLPGTETGSIRVQTATGSVVAERPIIGRMATRELTDEDVLALQVYEYMDSNAEWYANKGGKLFQATKRKFGLTESPLRLPPMQRVVTGTVVKSTPMTVRAADALETVLTSGVPAGKRNLLESFELKQVGRHERTLVVYDADAFQELVELQWRGGEGWEEVLNMRERDPYVDMGPASITKRERDQFARELAEGTDEAASDLSKGRKRPDVRRKTVMGRLQRELGNEDIVDAQLLRGELRDTGWDLDNIYGDFRGTGAPETVGDVRGRLTALDEAEQARLESLGAQGAWLKGKKASQWRAYGADEIDLAGPEAQALRDMGFTLDQVGEAIDEVAPLRSAPFDGAMSLNDVNVGVTVYRTDEMGQVYRVQFTDVDDEIARAARALDQQQRIIDRNTTWADASGWDKGTVRRAEARAEALESYIEWLEARRRAGDVPYRQLTPPEGVTITEARRRVKAGEEDVAKRRADIEFERNLIDEQVAEMDDIANDVSAVVEDMFGEMVEPGAVYVTPKGRRVRVNEVEFKKPNPDYVDQIETPDIPAELPNYTVFQLQMEVSPGRWKQVSGPAGQLLQSIPRTPRHHQFVGNLLDDIKRQIDNTSTPPSQTFNMFDTQSATRWDRVPSGQHEVIVFRRRRDSGAPPNATPETHPDDFVRVKTQRQMRFDSEDDALAEAERLRRNHAERMTNWEANRGKREKFSAAQGKAVPADPDELHYVVNERYQFVEVSNSTGMRVDDGAMVDEGVIYTFRPDEDKRFQSLSDTRRMEAAEAQAEEAAVRLDEPEAPVVDEAVEQPVPAEPTPDAAPEPQPERPAGPPLPPEAKIMVAPDTVEETNEWVEVLDSVADQIPGFDMAVPWRRMGTGDRRLQIMDDDQFADFLQQAKTVQLDVDGHTALMDIEASWRREMQRRQPEAPEATPVRQQVEAEEVAVAQSEAAATNVAEAEARRAPEPPSVTDETIDPNQWPVQYLEQQIKNGVAPVAIEPTSFAPEVIAVMPDGTRVRVSKAGLEQMIQRAGAAPTETRAATTAASVLDETPDTVPTPARETTVRSDSTTGTVQYGKHKIKVDGNEVKTPLFDPKRPVEVEQALVSRLLRTADELGVPLKHTVAKPSKKRVAQLEALGFEEVGRTKSKVTFERPVGREIPDEWPRAGKPVAAPQPEDGVTGWTAVTPDGEIAANAASRSELMNRLAQVVEDAIEGTGDLTKADLEEAFRILHESNPHLYMTPDEVMAGLDKAGSQMVERIHRPKPGFARDGSWVGPPRGAPRNYQDIESGPLHYFPLSNRSDEWDMALLELMATGRAHGDVVDDLDAARAAGTRVADDGREIVFDLDEMRDEAVSLREKRNIQNKMTPWLRQHSRVEDWNPGANGFGRGELRAPVQAIDPSKAGLYNAAVNWGFDIITSRPANLLSRGPMWHDAFMEALGEIYEFLTPANRERMLDYVRQSGGLHGGNHDVTNLLMSIIGKRKYGKMSNAEVENLLTRQARQVEKIGPLRIGQRKFDELADVGAAANGIDDLEEAVVLAQQVANERVKALLFDASQRNQFFEQFALIFPFGDAFVELLQRWGRAFTTSPHKFQNYIRTNRSLKALNGGLYDDDGMYSQDSGLMYSDPFTDEEMVMLPGSGWLSKVLTGDPNQMRFGLNAGSLSPLSVSVIPGLGPLVTMSSSAMQSFMPDVNFIDPLSTPWLYRQLYPFGVYDPELTGEGISGLIMQATGFPGWAQRMMTGVANLTNDSAKAALVGGSRARALENTAKEILRVGGANGTYDLSTRQSANEAAQHAFRQAARVEVIRALALATFGANAPSFYIPSKEEIELADDETIAQVLTYMAPVAYAAQYQEMLEANAGDFLAANIQFNEKFGFDPAWVRTGKSVATQSSPVTREGRLFYNANPDLVMAYPNAAYYLQPDPPASEFNYEAFRQGWLNDEREELGVTDYAFLLNNALALPEYQRWVDQVDNWVSSGQVPSNMRDQLLRERRTQLEFQYPGFNFEPKTNSPNPQDVAQEISQMVLEMGPDIEAFQFGPILREADQLVRTARLASRNLGRGDWWWATSDAPEAQVIRVSYLSAFQGLTKRDPRAGVLWNEVYSKLIPFGQPTRMEIRTDDPYFGTFFERDDYEEYLVQDEDEAMPVPETGVRVP